MKKILFPALFALAFLSCSGSDNGTTVNPNSAGTALTAEATNSSTGVYQHSSGLIVHAPLPAAYTNTSDSTFAIHLLDGTTEAFPVFFTKVTATKNYEESLAQYIDLGQTVETISNTHYQGFKQRTTLTLSSSTRSYSTYHIFFAATQYQITETPRETWSVAQTTALEQLIASLSDI